MKLLVSCVPYDQGKSGISVYIREVLKELTAQGHDLTLLVEPDAESYFPGYKTLALPDCTRRPALSMLYHSLVLPFRIRRDSWDACLLLAANRRAFCRYPLFTIAVIHDLAQCHVPQKYDRLRTFYLNQLLPRFIRCASQVVAISQSTKADLMAFWKVPESRIAVCYNGLTLTPDTDTHWPERHGLADKHYLLYVSRIEHPGKNHLNLIKAFEQLPDDLTRQHPLVIAGADWSGAEVVHAYAEASPKREHIVFTGFVATEDMASAYRHCHAYVFPSFFEGFGLSLIEAMHYGIPCGAANTSSLKEIGEGAARLFSPSDIDDIAAALKELLQNDALRRQLTEAGLRRAAQFSWTSHVQNLIQLIPTHAKPE